ncbi:MAG TPA: metallophosphoesterase [Clostridiales bacterium]|jgi:putative phosphoesterase|nr:metallophosphoesterase [Clostridiales bacterium]
MRIGVTGDTHGDLANIKRAVNALPDVDLWFHMGDFGSDFKKLVQLTGKHVDFVRGNCDILGSEAPNELVVEYGGVKFFLTHGHIYNVNFGIQKLVYRAQELNCQVALYGHTHIPQIAMVGDVLVLNPGSPTRPLSDSGKTVGLLTIENHKAKAEVFKL